MTDVEQAPAPVPESIAHNTAFALLVQLTTAFFTAATTLYLVRSLGPAGYGTFALALGISGIAGLVAKLGIPQSLARFLADNRSDAAVSAGLIRDALHLTLITSVSAGGALFLAAGWLATAFGDDGLVWPLRGIAISLVAETLIALFLGIFIALARIRSNLRIVFVESIVEAGASIAIVAAGFGAAGAAFGRAIGYGVGAALGGFLVFRLFGRIFRTVFRHTRQRHRRREILRYAFPLFVLDGIFGLFARIDVVLIGALLTTASVGKYSASRRLLSPIEGIGIAVANSVAPRQAPSEKGRFLRPFTSSLRWLTILHAAIIPPLVVWAGPIVSLLFGPKYADSANALRLLTPYIFLNGITALVSTTVNFLGLARQRIPIALTALALTVVVDVTLLPRIGIAAAAIGTSAAYCVYTPAHLLICRRHLGFSLVPLTRTACRSLAAAAAMGVVLAVAAHGGLSPVAAILGSVGGLVAYAATLIVTGEVTLREVRSGYGSLIRRVSARRAG